MKTKISRLTALVAVVVALLAVPSPILGQGNINIEAYNVLGQWAANQQFSLTTAYQLLAGPASFGIPNGGSVNTSNIFVSSGIGDAMYTAFAITDSSAFKLSQVQVSSTSPLYSYSGTLAQLGFNSYNNFGIGVKPDGTIITTGSTSIDVIAAYVIGPNYSINITGQTWDQATATWKTVGPFTSINTVSYGPSSASVKITFDPGCTSVPEPSSIAFAGLCVTSLLFCGIRKKC